MAATTHSLRTERYRLSRPRPKASSDGIAEGHDREPLTQVHFKVLEEPSFAIEVETCSVHENDLRAPRRNLESDELPLHPWDQLRFLLRVDCKTGKHAGCDRGAQTRVLAHPLRKSSSSKNAPRTAGPRVESLSDCKISLDLRQLRAQVGNERDVTGGSKRPRDNELSHLATPDREIGQLRCGHHLLNDDDLQRCA